MQISRRILLACVTATALLPLATFSGQDNAAQARARLALEQAMKDLPGQPTASPATNPPAKPQVQNAKPKKAPPAQAPVVKTKPKATEAPARAKAQALEDALHQKMNDSQALSPAPAAPAAVPPAAPPAVVVPSPAVSTPTQAAPEPSQSTTPEPARTSAPVQEMAAGPNYDSVVLPTAVSQGDMEKAQEVLRQKMSNQGSQTFAPQTTATPKKAPAARKASAKAIKTPTQLPPLQGPPLALSGSKDQRLQELLQLYKTDTLSPEAYHAQRAKILAEP